MSVHAVSGHLLGRSVVGSVGAECRRGEPQREWAVKVRGNGTTKMGLRWGSKSKCGWRGAKWQIISQAQINTMQDEGWMTVGGWMDVGRHMRDATRLYATWWLLCTRTHCNHYNHK